MDLLTDDELERSAVVANCRMNRERVLVGSNGYDRELGFNPLEFLKEQSFTVGAVAWLDLCCGTGKALIQAAEIVRTEGGDRRRRSGRDVPAARPSFDIPPPRRGVPEQLAT